MTAILVSLTRHFPTASAIRAVRADAAVAGRRINDWRLDLLNSDWHARVRVWMGLAGVRAHSTTTQPELDQAPHEMHDVPGYLGTVCISESGPMGPIAATGWQVLASADGG